MDLFTLHFTVGRKYFIINVIADYINRPYCKHTKIYSKLEGMFPSFIIHSWFGEFLYTSPAGSGSHVSQLGIIVANFRKIAVLIFELLPSLYVRENFILHILMCGVGFAFSHRDF